MPRAVLPSVFLAIALPGCGGISPFPDAQLWAGAGAGIVEDGTFRLDTLTVDPQGDGNGDGVEDNHFPAALATVELVLPEMSFGPDEFDAMLIDNVQNYTAIVFDAHARTEDFTLDVWQGLVQPDTTVALDPASEVSIDGGIAQDYSFNAGPGDLPLQFVVLGGSPPVSLVLYDTTVTGAWGDTALGGSFAGLLSIDEIVEQAVVPVIPESGWDLDGDGINEPKDTIVTLVDNLAPATADTVLSDGSPAISARFLFSADTTAVDLPDGS